MIPCFRMPTLPDEGFNGIQGIHCFWMASLPDEGIIAFGWLVYRAKDL